MPRMIDDELFKEIHGILTTHNYFSEAEEFRSAPSVKLLDLGKVARFGWFYDHDEGGVWDLRESDDGDWVRFSDLQSLVTPGQWIATDDGLPNDNARVFAYTRAGRRIVASFYNGHWFDEGSLERGVTHWQPLPPPPKE